MKKLIDESWLDEKIDEMEEIEANSSVIAYKNEARIIKLALKGVKNKLQSPIEDEEDYISDLWNKTPSLDFSHNSFHFAVTAVIKDLFKIEKDEF